jgi:chemotaxis protein methyltransferase CheR
MSVVATTVVADDYVGFCEGLRTICGVDLSQYRRPQMERRLRTYFERRGVTRLTDTLALLRSDRAELGALLDRVTINVSQLWRHPDQFTHLAATVLPELSRAGTVRAWSAGCSYGAEAFTLAAVCRTAIPAARVQILGSDIDPRMVARAREGVFSNDDARGVSEATMEASFDRVPEGWRAKPALRAMARFEVADLLRITPRASSHDLVMCRNTVIYFSSEVRDELHQRLAHSLRPGGYLVVGATERVTTPSEIGLEPVVPFIYRKA